MSLFSRSFAAASLLLSANGLQAQPVTPDQLMRHIRVLASDEYRGRAPGTAGGERSEAYVLEAFAQAGLTPGAADSSWRQTISVIERRMESGAISMTSVGRPIAVAPDDIVLVGRDPHVRIERAPVIFAGYGTTEEVAGVDIRGAVLLLISGRPPSQPNGRERRSALAAAGAAGLILVSPADTPWADFAAETRTDTAPVGAAVAPVVGAISNEAASAILGTAGDPRSLIALVATPNFRARRLPLQATLDVRTAMRTFETANIIGRVEGSSRPGEAVVVMAHWDHLGVCRPEGTPDRICNGAVDNASGTAILIEAARAVAAGPRPDRSIYFVATTSEEIGSLGAAAFADAPPPPITSIVVALNIDTYAVAPRGLPVAIIGRGRYPAIERVIDDTSRMLGRRVDTDTEANVMIDRQDGRAFIRRGIPAVMATGSSSDMRILSAFLASHYHRPSDDITQRIELGGAAEDTDLQIAIARALADTQRFRTR